MKDQEKIFFAVFALLAKHALKLNEQFSAQAPLPDALKTFFTTITESFTPIDSVNPGKNWQDSSLFSSQGQWNIYQARFQQAHKACLVQLADNHQAQHFLIDLYNSSKEWRAGDFDSAQKTVQVNSLYGADAVDQTQLKPLYDFVAERFKAYFPVEQLPAGDESKQKESLQRAISLFQRLAHEVLQLAEQESQDLSDATDWLRAIAAGTQNIREFLTFIQSVDQESAGKQLLRSLWEAAIQGILNDKDGPASVQAASTTAVGINRRESIYVQTAANLSYIDFKRDSQNNGRKISQENFRDEDLRKSRDLGDFDLHASKPGKEQPTDAHQVRRRQQDAGGSKAAIPVVVTETNKVQLHILAIFSQAILDVAERRNIQLGLPAEKFKKMRDKLLNKEIQATLNWQEFYQNFLLENEGDRRTSYAYDLWYSLYEEAQKWKDTSNGLVNVGYKWEEKRISLEELRHDRFKPVFIALQRKALRIFNETYAEERQKPATQETLNAYEFLLKDDEPLAIEFFERAISIARDPQQRGKKHEIKFSAEIETWLAKFNQLDSVSNKQEALFNINSHQLLNDMPKPLQHIFKQAVATVNHKQYKEDDNSKIYKLKVDKTTINATQSVDTKPPADSAQTPDGAKKLIVATSLLRFSGEKMGQTKLFANHTFFKDKSAYKALEQNLALRDPLDKPKSRTAEVYKQFCKTS